jgi:hypothetical protein
MYSTNSCLETTIAPAETVGFRIGGGIIAVSDDPFNSFIFDELLLS